MSPETVCAVGVVCVFIVAIMVACVLCQWANRLQGRIEQRQIDAKEYRSNPKAFEARGAKDALDQAKAQYGLEVFHG
jgi:hypothetical protein